MTRRHRRDAAGVHAAAEIGADRNIGDQLPVHGLHEQPLQFLGVFAVIVVAAHRARESDSPSRCGTPTDPSGADRHHLARAQHTDAGKERAIGEEVLEREVLEQRVRIDADAAPAGAASSALISLAKSTRRAVAPVIERLDPVAIARQEQPPRAGVPQAEREHPVEPRHAVVAPLLVAVDDDLAVGGRAKTVARPLRARRATRWKL